MSANRREFVDLFLGCAWLGAVLVPLNTGLRERGLRHALDMTEPSIVVAERQYAGLLTGCGRDPWPIDSVGPRAEAEPIRPAPVRPDDTAAVLFTSGTTGPPRGVRCPHAQFGWRGANVGGALRLTPDDVLYTCLPLFHTNALNALMQAMTAGSSLAQPPGPYDRAHRVTRALAPATPAHLWEPFRERFGVTLIDGFGSTETNYVIGAEVGGGEPGYMGTVRPGFSARVVDDALRPLPDGVPGELMVRSHRRCASGA